MGQIIIPMDSIERNITVDRWFMVGGRNDDTDNLEENKGEKKSSSGDIRLKLKYNEERILPSDSYNQLFELIMKDNLGIICALGNVTSERDYVAQTITNLFESKGQSLLLLNTLSSEEVDTTPNPEVIFRGNTIATKSLDAYMKLVGLSYLYKTLSPKIKQITEEKKSCEVGINKLIFKKKKNLNYFFLKKIQVKLINQIILKKI